MVSMAMGVPPNGWLISWNIPSKRMMTRGTPMSGNLQMLDMNGYDDTTCLGIDMMILLVLGIKQDIDIYDHLSSIGLDKLWI